MLGNYDPGEGPSSGNLQDKCSICDFATYDREKIVRHLTQHIMSKNNNSLELINMALNQLRVFHNEENHSTFSRNDSQEESKSSEEPGVPRVNSQGRMKTFPCKNCEFKAVTKLEYWNHIRMHIKSNKLMCCYKCPFVTEYKHHLEYHLLNHSGSKPFKCASCTYTCVNKSMLNSHMKSHSSIYQYRCKDCEYATKYCHTLKQHLRKYRHQPAAVLNVDGTQSPMVIDVYGTRRGPKQRPKNSNANNRPSTSTSTATATEEPSIRISTSTSTQTAANNEDDNSSNSNETNAQQSTSTSTQTLQSASTQALPLMPSGFEPSAMPASFTFSMLSNILNSRRNNNLVIQKNEHTGQETVHYPFQYNHSLFTTLNMATQQLLPNGSFVLNETTSTTTTNDNSERENLEDSEEEAIMTTPTMDTEDTEEANQPEFFESSTAENTVMPLDLTSRSLKDEAGSSQTLCQLSPLNLANSPRAAGTRRRKGIAIKLEHRIVEKEEDTDEETTQSEKRHCQSTSPQAASAPSTSLATTSAPSTSPQAASIPSISLMTAFTPSNSLMAAATSSILHSTASIPSTSLIDTAVQTALLSSPEDGAVDAAEFANRRQMDEKKLTHNRSFRRQDHFMCLHCNIMFPDRTVYVAHTRFHDNMEPFMCKVCGNTYGNREAFNLHIFENKCRK